MNWYNVSGVMKDGSRNYSEKVIVAADTPSEAIEKANKILCHCIDNVYRVRKVSLLDPNYCYVIYRNRIIPIR